MTGFHDIKKQVVKHAIKTYEEIDIYENILTHILQKHETELSLGSHTFFINFFS